MRRTLTALCVFALATPCLAEVTPLFATDGAGNATLLVHPHELRRLDTVDVPLPTGDLTLDLRLLDERGGSSYTLVGSVPGMPLLHAIHLRRSLNLNGVWISTRPNFYSLTRLRCTAPTLYN